MSGAEAPRSTQRRANVVLFGEVGAGKSSVVNLISGLDHDIARTSSGSTACTFDTRPYYSTIQGREFRIFDTVGLTEPSLLRDPDILIGSINKAYRLVKYLSDTGGINLLVFCVRRGRITVGAQTTYMLFNDLLCYKRVPVVLVITHLEHEETMEDWWDFNHTHFSERGILVVGHACITAKREFVGRYQHSRRVFHDLLVSHSRQTGFTRERVSWLTDLFARSLGPAGVDLRMNPRVRKLREYGLRDDEISALLKKINAVDADRALVRPMKSLTLMPSRGRGNPAQPPTSKATPTAVASASGNKNDNFGGTNGTTNANPTSSTRLNEEAHSHVIERRFSDDLTRRIIREGPEPVASGGFADIYRGTLQSNTKTIKVAIKAIKTYSCEDGNFSKKEKRLHREVKVWSDLKHDNILPLLGTTMGFSRFPAMVCPWAENGTLTSYLKGRHVGLSAVAILTLLDNVASGLHYLHSRLIVHGDLSGSNIQINKDGSACITDFGISTLLPELEGLTFATSFHARGTIRWIAPELLDLSLPESENEIGGPSNISPKLHSDVYSFGGVMLQILSGQVPYHYYANEMQVVHAILKGWMPRRPSDNKLVTDGRWTFIQRCWSAIDARPSSNEIVCLTKDELARVVTS